MIDTLLTLLVLGVLMVAFVVDLVVLLGWLVCDGDKEKGAAVARARQG